MASTVTYRDDAEYELITDEQLLAKAQAKLEAVLDTAEEYEIMGSRKVKNQIAALERLISRYEKRILLKKGYTGRNAIDHSTLPEDEDVPNS